METHILLRENYKLAIFRTLTSVESYCFQVTSRYKLGFAVERDAEVLDKFSMQ